LSTKKDLILSVVSKNNYIAAGILNGLLGRGGLGRNIIRSYRRCLAAKVIGTVFVRRHYVCHCISPAWIVATQAAPPLKPVQNTCSNIIYFGQY
jgi:hypothetical protein